MSASDEGVVYEEFHADPQAYVEKLLARVDADPKNVALLQTAAEVLFEAGAAERALPLVLSAIELDNDGQFGDAKFLWAGQIYGGKKGLAYYKTGVNNLVAKISDDNQAALLGTLCQAYLGMIEIWMTDLCMEPEAEQRCEQLIAEAFLCKEDDPEAWSVLGSIRISQIKSEDAMHALQRAWVLFQQTLAAATVPDYTVVQKLVRLAQNMLELRMYDEILEVTTEIHNLDDQVSELYYLNCFTHCELAKLATDKEIETAHVEAAKEAVELLEKVEDADQEVLEASVDLVNALTETAAKTGRADRALVAE